MISSTTNALPFKPIHRRPVWSLSRPLLRFGNDVDWLLRDAVESVMIQGMPGCGKTSGSASTIIRSLLEADFGGLFLCSKITDRAMYERQIRQCGRADQLVIVGPGRHHLNFMEYLARHHRPGVRDVKNIVQFFETIVESYLGNRGGQEDEAFWSSSRRQLMSNILRILAHSGSSFSLDDMLDFLREAPKSLEEVAKGGWLQSKTFASRLRAALQKSAKTPDERTVQRARDWWMTEFAAQPSKTRECVQMSFLSLCDAFNDPVMREVFGSDTTVVPEHCQEGALVIVDISVKEYGAVGILAQQIWKVLFQQCVERRDDPDDDSRLPVFEVIDEAQLFFHPSDTLFQSTTRSSRCCVLAITQNLPNIIGQVGGANAEATVNAWLGNFNTLVLHAQGEPTTAKWMAEQCGRSKKFKVSGSDDSQSFFEHILSGNGKSRGVSVSSEEDYNVPPGSFRGLRTGGPENNFEVDAYVVMQSDVGRRTGRYYIPVVFSQRSMNDDSPPAEAGRLPWYRRLLPFFIPKPRFT